MKTAFAQYFRLFFIKISYLYGRNKFYLNDRINKGIFWATI